LAPQLKRNPLGRAVKVIDEAQFRAWLAEGGIGPHSRWGNTDTLVCVESEELSRFWFPSNIPSELPGFILAALRAASSGGPHYLLKRGGGNWYESDLESAPGSNVIIDALLKAAGVPAEAAGGLRFEKEDWKALSIVSQAYYVNGWSVGEDLHMFGEERDCAMMISHHGELIVHFPNWERLERFQTTMLEAGYDLPTELPDETFKRPDWMG
jgi:hypothetical protein